VSEPGTFDLEMAIKKLKGHKSPSIIQIPAKLIKAGGRTIHYVIHKLIISIWNNEELPEKLKLIDVPIYKKGNKTGCSNYRAYQFANYVQNFIQHPALKVNSICRGNY
jgi:hypothetical protein